MVRSSESVVEEIKYWHERFGVEDFVFYDDALLVDAEKHATPIFEGIINSGFNIRFHTPNAVHIRGISRQTAQLMFRAGFKTLRLGLETASFDARQELDKKVTSEEFRRAVTCLKEAGFHQNEIGAYLLVGLPGQDISFMAMMISSTVLRSVITNLCGSSRWSMTFTVFKSLSSQMGRKFLPSTFIL